MRKIEEQGRKIAQQLGNDIVYNGPQYLNDDFMFHVFTDGAVTGTTFAAKTFEEAKANLIEKRKLFGAKPPIFDNPTGGNPVPEVAKEVQGKTVYHGTREDITALKHNPMYGSKDYGFSESYAKYRSQGGRPKVYEVKFIMSNPAGQNTVDEVIKYVGIDPAEGSSAALAHRPEVMAELKKRGFDSIKNVWDFGFRSDFEEVPVSMVFDAANQAKIIREIELAKIANPPAVEAGNPILGTMPIGTCYDDAWRAIIRLEEGELVHGSVESKGKRIGHAWVELPTGFVWEPETGDFTRTSIFRDVFKPVEDARYSDLEAAKMAARIGNFGPWTQEERGKILKGGNPVEEPKGSPGNYSRAIKMLREGSTIDEVVSAKVVSVSEAKQLMSSYKKILRNRHLLGLDTEQALRDAIIGDIRPPAPPAVEASNPTSMYKSVVDLPEFRGRAWRAESGYTHLKGTTAADIIRFEREELGNEYPDVSDELLKELDRYSAYDVVWVNRRRKDCLTYLSEGESEEAVGRVDLGGGAKIITPDYCGGYLVLRGSARTKEQIAATEVELESLRRDLTLEAMKGRPEVYEKARRRMLEIEKGGNPVKPQTETERLSFHERIFGKGEKSPAERLGKGQAVNDLMPMPPDSGPPLPRMLKIRWPWKK